MLSYFLVIKRSLSESSFQNSSHLLKRRALPFIISMRVLRLLSRAILMFKTGNVLEFFLRAVFCFFRFFMWIKAVSNEALLGEHSPIVKTNIKKGFLWFLFREVMFFFGWFWEWFHNLSVLGVDLSLGGVEVITPIDPFSLPLLNTILLLARGAFITLFHKKFLVGSHFTRCGLSTKLWEELEKLEHVGGGENYFPPLNYLLYWICAFVLRSDWLWAILRGIVFLCLQYTEYITAPFDFSDSVYGRGFFVITGFHGIHVMVGLLFLAYNIRKIYANKKFKYGEVSLECSLIYWHFVDVVWLFLFIFVYIWPY